MAPQMPLARAGRPAIGQPYNGKCAPDTQCANKKKTQKNALYTITSGTFAWVLVHRQIGYTIRTKRTRCLNKYHTLSYSTHARMHAHTRMQQVLSCITLHCSTSRRPKTASQRTSDKRLNGRNSASAAMH